MAKPGPKPEPDAKKHAKGETRPSRMAEASQGGSVVVAFPVVDKVPEPPDWMVPDGQQLWRDIAPMLYAQKVLTKADLAALTHLCQLHGMIQGGQNGKMGYKAGIPPVAAELTQLRMLFSEFGLTPSSRTRVPHGSKEGGNRFGNNGKDKGQA